MERNTITKINALKVGDRFYKLHDRKKTVWTKTDHAPKKTNYYTYTNFANTDDKMYPEPFKHDTQVVFLRRPVLNEAQ